MVRALKYAILGLLSQESCSGYDLSMALSGALQEFWSANHSQIYPELKRLSEEGLVDYQVEISGNVLERKVYSLTEAGRADFLEWLHREEDIASPPKDVFRLRMFFANEMEPERRRDLIAHELTLHRERLARLRGKREQFAVPPEPSSPALGDYMVLTGAVRREEASCEWLSWCLTVLDGAATDTEEKGNENV